MSGKSASAGKATLGIRVDPADKERWVALLKGGDADAGALFSALLDRVEWEAADEDGLGIIQDGFRAMLNEIRSMVVSQREEATREIEALVMTNAETEKALRTEREEKKSLALRVADLEKSAASIERMQSTFDSREADLLGQIYSLKEQIKELSAASSRCAELEALVSELREQRSEARRREAQMSREKIEAEQKAEARQVDLEEARVELAREREISRSATKEAQKAKADLEDCKTSLARAVDEVARERVAAEDARSKAVAFERDLKAERREHAEVRHELESRNSAKKSRRGRMSATQTRPVRRRPS